MNDIENYNKNLKQQNNIEKISKNMEFIHAYNNFYMTSEANKGHFLEQLRENFCSLVVSKSKNNQYVVFVYEKNHINTSIYHSLIIIFIELQKLYPDLTCDNLYFSEFDNMFSNHYSFYYHNDNPKDIDYSGENHSNSKLINFTNYTQYDLSYLKTFLSFRDNLTENNFFRKHFTEEEIKNFLTEKHIHNQNALNQLIYAMSHNFSSNINDFILFLISFIEDNKIEMIEDSDYIDFFNFKFLEYDEITYSFLLKYPFFTKEYLKYIKAESFKEFNKTELIELKTKFKLDNF